MAHNAPFDRRFLVAAFERAGLSFPDVQMICTQKEGKKRQPGLSGHKLDILCTLYGVPLTQHHDAGHDARACGDLWVAMQRRTSPPAMGQGSLLAMQPMEVAL